MSDFMYTIKHLFSIRTRASRREFLVGTLYFYNMIMIMLQAFIVADYFCSNVACYFILGIALPILGIVCLKIRRLHDIGVSGFWFFVPFIGLRKCAKDNKWGFDTSVKYGVSHFTDTKEYYTYLRKRPRYKHCMFVSLVIVTLKLLLSVSVLFGATYAILNYDTNYRNYDRIAHYPLQIKQSDDWKKSDATVSDVYGMRYKCGVNNEVILYVSTDPCKDLTFKRIGSTYKASGVIENDGYRIGVKAIYGKPNKKEAINLVSSALQRIEHTKELQFTDVAVYFRERIYNNLEELQRRVKSK